MLRIIRATDFAEGRWKNGMGISWDIASDPPGAGADHFGWRFAIARIDADVPFSAYPEVDRLFTLIDGNGLALDVDGQGLIDVNRRHIPHGFPGDAPTSCRLKDGPCRALNLFLARRGWSATVEIISGTGRIAHDGPVLLFALDGSVHVGGDRLEQGDAAIARGEVRLDAGACRLYAARLTEEN
ncbi:MAG: HutD family protein [Alphaproteobacteria bacterium]|nr:HutD family protein [Alphaproteobacteria bacterium]